MRFIIDSNIYIYASGQNTACKKFLTNAENADWAGYSAITRLEVLGYPGITTEETTLLELLLQEYVEVPIHCSIIDTAVSLRKRRSIKAPDSIVAASALYMEATLVTRNTKDFTGIDNLRLLNPFEP